MKLVLIIIGIGCAIVGWLVAGFFVKPSLAETPSVPSRPSAPSLIPGKESLITPLANFKTNSRLERRLQLDQSASRDPRAALEEILKSSPNHQGRFDAITAIFRIWASENLAGAIDAYLENRHRFGLRDSVQGRLFRDMCAADPATALQILRDRKVKITDAIWEYELTVGALARTDPAAAMQRALEFKALFEGEKRSEPDQSYLNNNSAISVIILPTFERAVLEEWMKHDADAVISWLETEGEGLIDEQIQNWFWKRILEIWNAKKLSLIFVAIYGKSWGRQEQICLWNWQKTTSKIFCLKSARSL
ncbi:MAG: hypothetical protein AAF514_18700 [Verrucomicrobiota bacterium]